MTPIRIARSLAAALICIAAGAANAQAGLTPARYFECQIAARQATVAGLEERQAFLGKGSATSAERQASDEQARDRVTKAFARCGYSAGTLGSYAHRNADELQAWLAANPQVKAQLDAVGQRVTNISARMQAASPSAKP
jgi:hypothetical protein